MKNKTVKILHEGEDYISIKYGKNEYEITGHAIDIIKTLLKINKNQNANIISKNLLHNEGNKDADIF